jgi:hypothetical protein
MLGKNLGLIKSIFGLVRAVSTRVAFESEMVGRLFPIPVTRLPSPGGDSDALASQRLPIVLALKIEPPTKPPPPCRTNFAS